MCWLPLIRGGIRQQKQVSSIVIFWALVDELEDSILEKIKEGSCVYIHNKPYASYKYRIDIHMDIANISNYEFTVAPLPRNVQHDL